MTLEKMSDFFNQRSEDYENHMMANVSGAKVYYKKVAELMPKEGKYRLLDLGCGTGLEMDEIVKVNPKVSFTGIDLAVKMTEQLVAKHKDKVEALNIINKDYYQVDYGNSFFDVALSVQTLHHFTHGEKIHIYRKLFDGLTADGYYIEVDYMAKDLETEKRLLRQFSELKQEQNVDGGWFHYDIPCTVDNNRRMLLQAGFTVVDKVWQEESTVMLLAKKR